MKAHSARAHFTSIRQDQRIGRRQREPSQRSFRPLKKAPKRKQPAVQGVNNLVKRTDGLLQKDSVLLQSGAKEPTGAETTDAQDR